MTPTSDSDIVHPALETLLTVVASAAADLRMFHDTMTKARIGNAPPFPRTAVAATSRIIKNLKSVETDLKKVLIALGLPESPDGT